MRGRKWTMVLVPLFLGASVEFAKADIKLKLTYDVKYSFSTVQIPSRGEIDYVLKKNDVEVYGVNNGTPFFAGSKSKGRGYFFGPLKIGVRADAHRVEFTGTYRTHVVRAVITTDGVSSCNAELSAALRPGQSTYEYEYGALKIEISDLSYHNVRCELSTS